MSQPPAYTRQQDYTDWESTHPTTPKRGSDLDADFDAIKAFIDAMRNNIALIQRDDGALKNAIVTPDSLSTATLALLSTVLNPTGDWATATEYELLDLAVYQSAVYVCIVEHTSGTFATDLAAGKWMLFANPVNVDGTAYFERFSGTGAQTAFTLSQTFGTDEKAIMVFVDGAILDPVADYTISGTTLTFATAPAAGTNNIHVWGTLSTATAILTACAAAQTAAEAAQTAAEAAQTAAETAQGAAETAQSAAETAQAAAETAQAGAETAQTNAAASAAAASASETAAGASETAAAASAAAASASETAAALSEGNAGNSAIAAAASAAAAAASESAAATSETNAAASETAAAASESNAATSETNAAASAAAAAASAATLTPASQAEAEAGTENTKYMTALRTAQAIAALGSTSISVAVLQDQKSDGTNGGGSTSGSWQTRDLNTEVSDPDGIVTLSSNKFTPVAGTYLAFCKSAIVASSEARQRLYNVTAGSQVALGIHEQAVNTSDLDVTLPSTYVFTANGTDEYALQTQVSASRATDGFGQHDAMTLGVEIFAEVVLIKLA